MPHIHGSVRLNLSASINQLFSSIFLSQQSASQPYNPASVAVDMQLQMI
jgi:hypothetical protein